MYFKDRYKSTDIHIYEQANETIRLLQANKKYPLSKFYSNEGKVKAIINCSYFSTEYVLGRNQGDLKNDTHDQEGFYDLVFLKDGSYRLDNFKSWDYTDVLAGFSVATVLIKDGLNCERCSSAICNNTKISSRNPQTCVAVLKGNKVIFIVSEGRNSNDVGLTGYDVRNYVRENYPDVELLVQLDGGGSSEMIVDGVIKNYLSDGKERPMFNGLALLKKEEPKEEPKGEDNMATKVLDVSSYQPNIDYAKVKASGIGGVILRCGRTYWGEMVVAGDNTFEKHYNGFKAVGMPVGVYYYSAANTVDKAKKEAEFVLNVLKGKQLELPVYFDVENNERQKPLSKQALTDVTKAFCEVIEKAGYYVGIYASSSWLKDELDMNQLNNYDVWVAHYGVSKPSYTGNYGMWQYTSSGTVDGINGNVDLSNCYKDYPTIIKNAKLNGYKEEEEAESNQTDKLKEEIADLKAKLTSFNSQLVEANKLVNDKETEIVKLEKKLKEINDISKDYA